MLSLSCKEKKAMVWVCLSLGSAILCVSYLVLVLTGGERLSRTGWFSWPEGIPRSRRLAWATGTQGMSVYKLGTAPIYLTFFMPTPGCWEPGGNSTFQPVGGRHVEFLLSNLTWVHRTASYPKIIQMLITWKFPIQLSPPPWSTQSLYLHLPLTSLVLHERINSFCPLFRT